MAEGQAPGTAKPFIVDGDGHVMEPDSMWPEYLESKYHSLAPKRVRDDEGRSVLMMEGRLLPQARPVTASTEGAMGHGVVGRAGGYDPRARIADQDVEEIDVAVLYPTTGLRVPGVADPELAVALSRAYNDWLADFCKDFPKRFAGIALVPIQDVDAAIAEAQRAVGKLGFRGVFLRPNPVNGRNLFHPAYEPFWAAVQELEVPVAFHEGTHMVLPTAGADRFDNHWLRHMVSHPHEHQIACMSLIGGGVLERYPRLKVGFLESGSGWIAHWLERMDDHVETFGNLVHDLSMKPSEYFTRQGFIAADPGERALPAMAQLVGDGVLVWASDYPHPDQPFPGATRLLLDRTDLPTESKIKILGENAARVYALAR